MVKSSLFYFVIFSIIVVLLLIFVGKQEGFDLYAPYANDRNGYIQRGKQTYNALSETTDVKYPNFLNTTDPKVLQNANMNIMSALQTSDPYASQTNHALFETTAVLSRATLAPQNKLSEEVKKCEALQSRDACAKLDDPNFANCGVCLKGGSPQSYNTHNHIGGMLLLSEDRRRAEDFVKGTNTSPMYNPTIGECPSGLFYATKSECEKQANRLDCSESGQTGGFDGGITMENKDIVAQKCAQVMNATSNTFIYEPKNRVFNLNLRALAPVGTGICKIFVYNSQKAQIGFQSSDKPGEEFVVPVRNVKENDPLSVVVMLEAPYRYGPNRELYQIRLAHPTASAADAAAVCRRYGSTQATMDDLNSAVSQANGSQVCNPGWTAEGLLAWPVQVSSSFCGQSGVNTKNDAKLGDIWCMGLRPPNSENVSEKVTISNWYESPNSKYTIVSKFETGNPTPFARGILLQWEMASGKSNRIVGFETTITTVNGIGPSNVVSDENIFSNLRTFGTFAASSTFNSPKYKDTSTMLGSRPWIWSKNALSQQITFTTVVPGIFLDSFYPEDLEISMDSPIIGNPELAKKFGNDPCKAAGAGPKSYNLSCLESAFVAAGGDIRKGEIATKNGGLTQLNTIGNLRQISNYLDTLYSIATQGKDLQGKFVGSNQVETRTIINSAAMNMFGFTIASPCEMFALDTAENVVILPKQGKQIDAWCLDYLWTNTGSEFENGWEDSEKTIQHTYTNIGQRFSGLRSSESTAKLRSEHPFTLCQRTGTAAPINAEGNINIAAVHHAQSLLTIRAIQEYYNRLYNSANNSNVKNPIALQQCYGLQSTPIVKEPTFSSTYLGCYTDTHNRAVPTQHTNVTYTGDGEDGRKKCMQMALTKGDNVYAIQYGGVGYAGAGKAECFTGKDPNYAKYGTSTACGPMGGRWANQVYKIHSSAPEVIQSPAPNVYTFHQGMESGGNDLGRYLSNNVPALKIACDKHPMCKGFTTNGMLKSAILPNNRWYKWTNRPNSGLYVKL